MTTHTYYVDNVFLQILHKRLTSESVLIFENFILKVADFSTNEICVQTEKLPRPVSYNLIQETPRVCKKCKVNHSNCTCGKKA